MRATGIPSWMVRDHRVHRALHRLERADRRRHRFRDGMQPQRHLGDDAERAFGADEQAGQIVARGRFARARAGLDHAAVGEHRGQPEDVLAHRAVADRGRAGRARRGHPAERGVRARDRSGTSIRCCAATLASCSRVTPASTVTSRSSALTCSTRFISRRSTRDAAVKRVHVPFERGAGAERNDRQLNALADARDLRRPRRWWWGSRRCRERRAGDTTRRDCDGREPRRRPTRATRAPPSAPRARRRRCRRRSAFEQCSRIAAALGAPALGCTGGRQSRGRGRNRLIVGAGSLWNRSCDIVGHADRDLCRARRWRSSFIRPPPGSACRRAAV